LGAELEEPRQTQTAILEMLTG